MAVLNRLQLINEAKYKAGVDSTAVALTTEFDQVLRDITARYDLLRANYATGNLTAHASNNYLAVPTDFKHINHMKADSSNRTEVVELDPDIFWSYALSFGAGSVPTKAVYNPADGRIYLNPFPSTGTVAYYLWYSKYHLKSTGDTYSHVLGEEFDETITLCLAAYACEIVKEFNKANYFRLLYEEDLKMKSDIRRKRLIRYEYPER